MAFLVWQKIPFKQGKLRPGCAGEPRNVRLVWRQGHAGNVQRARRASSMRPEPAIAFCVFAEFEICFPPGKVGLMTLSSDTAIDGIVKSFGSDRSRLMDIVIAVQHRLATSATRRSRRSPRALASTPWKSRRWCPFMLSQPGARGRNRIRLSKTPISFMKGAKEVARAFEEALGLPLGETSARRRVHAGVDERHRHGRSGAGGSGQRHGPDRAHAGGCAADRRGALRRSGNKDRLPPTRRMPRTQRCCRKPSGAPSLVQAGPLLSGPLGPAAGIKAALALTPKR